MKASDLMYISYHGWDVAFGAGEEYVWLNLTSIANHFNKTPEHWLRTQQAKNFVDALCRQLNTDRDSVIRTKKGGSTRANGTWAINYIALEFARWCDPDFGVWCNMQLWFVADKLDSLKQRNKELTNKVTELENKLKAIPMPTPKKEYNPAWDHWYKQIINPIQEKKVVTSECDTMVQDFIDNLDIYYPTNEEVRNIVADRMMSQYTAIKSKLKSV